MIPLIMKFPTFSKVILPQKSSLMSCQIFVITWAQCLWTKNKFIKFVNASLPRALTKSWRCPLFGRKKHKLFTHHHIITASSFEFCHHDNVNRPQNYLLQPQLMSNIMTAMSSLSLQYSFDLFMNSAFTLTMQSKVWQVINVLYRMSSFRRAAGLYKRCCGVNIEISNAI